MGSHDMVQGMRQAATEHLEAEAFKAVMRKLAATVTVVTVQGAAGRNGLTATAVCSVSAEPPQLLCCINRAASPLEDIRRAGVFAVNILKPDHRHLAERFAREPSGEHRFAEGNWSTGPAGAPVLADATAWLECRLVDLIEAGSHAIAIGLVTDGGRDDGSQLVYAEGAYHVLQRVLDTPG
jgi:flavin reductase (DIM6/NTAB) family NADH-FMN oxidoreductase RutF